MSILYKELLMGRILRYALREGCFTLSSAGRSKWFFDMMRVLQSDALWAAGHIILDEAIRPYQADAIGGMESGAIPFMAAALSAAATCGVSLTGFLAHKGGGSKLSYIQAHGNVEGPEIFGNVVILDDVITTGRSAKVVIDYLAHHSPHATICAVYALIDRGAGEFFDALGIPYRYAFSESSLLSTHAYCIRCQRPLSGEGRKLEPESGVFGMVCPSCDGKDAFTGAHWQIEPDEIRFLKGGEKRDG